MIKIKNIRLLASGLQKYYNKTVIYEDFFWSLNLNHRNEIIFAATLCHINNTLSENDIKMSIFFNPLPIFLVNVYCQLPFKLSSSTLRHFNKVLISFILTDDVNSFHFNCINRRRWSFIGDRDYEQKL